jgi:energy-coupling factor transporter ATP-binding protein EcfA2
MQSSIDTSDRHQFTSVSFRNYKAFKRYSITLRDFNVLVGPNNAGKSTIIGAFRILSEGLRKAAARKPEFIHLPGRDEVGYRLPLDDLPVSTENIFTNYDESEPAEVEFRLSSGNSLSLIFPESNSCCMVCETKSRPVKSPSDFKREYKASVGFVPVLGPVEHEEPLYQKEAARMALLSHRASRNFRNIWHHYPEGFNDFRELIRTTWPGMDIEKPEIQFSRDKSILHMFCPEERYPREIYWAGFGFQVWCQMLTYIVRSKNDSLIIIDEPDIYLHSDLQRQLIGLLKNLGPDILLATHSTEIISEADPGDLVIINKKSNAAKRISDPSQLQSVFGVLGSNLNPTLTQLAKSRRAVFVEGKDFQIFAAFARKLGKQAIANRSDFAVIPVEGFNPQKVSDFSKGMELTLGTKLLKAVVFDRDYRSSDEVKEVKNQLAKTVDYAHIHNRKEIENYVLEPAVIDRALKKRIKEHNKRSNDNIILNETASVILETLTQSMKNHISGQYLSKRTGYEKGKHPELDYATINKKLLDAFEAAWKNLKTRFEIVPGKELLSQLNGFLQEKYKVTLSVSSIVSAMKPEEVPDDIRTLMDDLDSFRVMKTN